MSVIKLHKTHLNEMLERLSDNTVNKGAFMEPIHQINYYLPHIFLRKPPGMILNISPGGNVVQEEEVGSRKR